MFNFFRRKQPCPFCEQIENDRITLSFEELDKYNFHAHSFSGKRNSNIKLIVNEDYKIYQCTDCNTFMLINGRDFIRVNDKIKILKNWYKGYSSVRPDFKSKMNEIGFSKLGDSFEYILPCKIKVGEIEHDFVTLIASKYFPVYQTLYFNRHVKPSNYFF